MPQMEDQFEAACAARDLPGVVLLASDATGNVIYQRAFGPKTPNEPMGLDATFIMASCTKLMASVAAMQCVERGQITLDEEVSRVLPELKDKEVLTGFSDDGTPVLEKSTVAITLRHLLTHTSGFAYDAMHPLLIKWRKTRGEKVGPSAAMLMQHINIPLLYEPGTSWSYGVSLDWVGVMVSRLNHTTLEEYMKRNIWTPLGITNMTFHQEKHPAVQKSLVKLSARGPEGTSRGFPDRTAGLKVKWTDELIYPFPVADEAGGHGLIGSAVEYMKLLTSLLSPSCTILSSKSIEQMFTPQFEPNSGSLKAYEEHIKFPIYIDGFASLPQGTKVNWGLGSVITGQDLENGRKKGTLGWSGLPNLNWTVDRESGLALFYASNIVPFGDFKSAEFQRMFEGEMYKRFVGKERGGDGAKM